MLNGKHIANRAGNRPDVHPSFSGDLGRCECAFRELLKAFEYAQSSRREVWDFAVEIHSLRTAGLTDTDLRWLASLGHVEHACEVTMLGSNQRHFQCTGTFSFANRTCFVLTDAGVGFTRSLLHGAAASTLLLRPAESPKVETPAIESSIPAWDAERRELRLGSMLVKQFKWPAMNQELILSAFHEEGWPARIDDPLPPHPEQDSKRRLSDTIKCLNRKQQNRLLHFRSDGTGEGVIWERSACDSRCRNLTD